MWFNLFLRCIGEVEGAEISIDSRATPYIRGHPSPGCSGLFFRSGDDVKPDQCLGELPLGTLPPGDSSLPASLQSPVFPVLHVSLQGSSGREHYPHPPMAFYYPSRLANMANITHHAVVPPSLHTKLSNISQSKIQSWNSLESLICHGRPSVAAPHPRREPDYVTAEFAQPSISGVPL